MHGRSQASGLTQRWLRTSWKGTEFKLSMFTARPGTCCAPTQVGLVGLHVGWCCGGARPCRLKPVACAHPGPRPVGASSQPGFRAPAGPEPSPQASRPPVPAAT